MAAADEQEETSPFRRLSERAASAAGDPSEQLIDVLAESYAVLRAVNEQDDNRPAALAFAAAKLAHHGREEAEHVQRLILNAIVILAQIGDDICRRPQAEERRAA